MGEENNVAEQVGTQSEPEAQESNASFEETTNQQTSDGDAQGGEEGSAQDGEVKTNAASDKQSKNEVNAKYAEARRAKEREVELQRTRAQARIEAVIEATGGVNPYTQEKITDEKDVSEFLTMRKIAQSGGDPLHDYAKTIKQQMRDAETAAKRENDQREWYATDRESFAAAYPDVNLSELIRDKSFARFADGKVGRIPLTEIYKDYQDVMSKITAEAERKAARTVAQREANKQATPGALSGSGEGKAAFTREQVKQMTQEEVHKNYDKIMESQKYW